MDSVTSIQSKSLGSQRGSSLSGLDSGDVGGRAGHGGKPWDGMNGIAANLLLNLTAGMRFDGSLNVDINDHNQPCSLPKASFSTFVDVARAVSADRRRNIPAPRTMDQIFTEVFGRDRQLASVDPRRSTYLACADAARRCEHIGRKPQRGKAQTGFGRWHTGSRMV